MHVHQEGRSVLYEPVVGLGLLNTPCMHAGASGAFLVACTVRGEGGGGKGYEP